MFNLRPSSFMFFLDEPQNATIAQTQEKTNITGKQGRKLNSLKKNKAVTISGTETVMWADYLTVSGNAATTSYTAVGTTGNEIESVYVKNSDGTLGTLLEQDSAVAEGKFTYDPSTKALAFNEGEIADNTEIVVYYMRKIQADVPKMKPQKEQPYMITVDNKFQIGDTCYTHYRKPVHYKCPVCDGNGKFQYNGYEVRCPNCSGSGKLHNSHQTVETPCEVKIKSVRASLDAEGNIKTVVNFTRERGYHPTQKPVPLLEYLIRTYTNEGGYILDNCMGSGSTGVACVNTNREFIGIELDVGYFETAKKRIKEAYIHTKQPVKEA